jgi:hypothetical protein
MQGIVVPTKLFESKKKIIKKNKNLVSLYITEELSSADGLPLRLVPLDDGPLAHGGGQRGHLDGGSLYRSTSSGGSSRGS